MDDRTDHVLDLIDGALRGDTSPDAMRWTPDDEHGEQEPAPTPRPEPEPARSGIRLHAPTTVVVMVGGPLHGQANRLPCTRQGLPMVYLAASRESFAFDFSLDPPETCSMRQHTYNLRWYNGRVPWQPWQEPDRHPVYVCMDEPAPIQLSARPTEEEIHYARVAETLWRQMIEDALPNCVVPGCAEKGRYTFTAAEYGRLAGREWQPGDQIRICPNHGHDIYRAQGAYGLDQLADWLRPDARYDTLDAYDIGTDLLYGDQIRHSRARMLRLTRNQP